MFTFKIYLIAITCLFFMWVELDYINQIIVIRSRNRFKLERKYKIIPMLYCVLLSTILYYSYVLFLIVHFTEAYHMKRYYEYIKRCN